MVARDAKNLNQPEAGHIPTRKMRAEAGDPSRAERDPHQRLTSSVSVQTFQTISTDALNVRVTSICFAVFVFMK